MTRHVFLSYKREDEAIAARIAQGLERNGLTVWWDRSLMAGENWHEQIGTALDDAGCVVVLWSEGSVAAAGQFVRDEARRAARRGLLIPVRIAPVQSPLGFGELQAIDLTRWRGRADDLDFVDLVAAIRARLEGRPTPPARAATRRRARRFTLGSLGTALLATLALFAANVFHVQDRTCAMAIGQPGLSDLCGRIGIGGRPTRDERVAWSSRQAGNCTALREHIAHYPDGTYRSIAADLLAAAHVERSTDFEPTPRDANGYVRQSERGFATVAEAQADARRRADADARTLTCAARDADERLDDVTLDLTDFDCRGAPGGTTCALSYRARCLIDARPRVERCGR